jgi:hypothetical protein
MKTYLNAPPGPWLSLVTFAAGIGLFVWLLGVW